MAGENEKGNEHYQRACRAFRRGLQIQPANTKLRHAIEMALGTASRAQRGKGSQEDDEINLSFEGIGNKMGLRLANSLGQYPHLRKLCLKDNRLTNESLSPLITRCQDLKHLMKLDIGGNKVSDATWETICHLLAHENFNVEELGISKSEVDTKRCAELFSKLSVKATVKILDLSSNLIGRNSEYYSDFGITEVKDFLKNEKCKLVVLDLSWNNLQNDLIDHLGSGLSQNNTIEEINLSHNSFGQCGGEAIGDMMLRNRTILKMNLSYNGINHKATFAIAQGLRENPNLCDIDISGNPIGDIGGYALMQVAIEKFDIIDIKFGDNNITVRDPDFAFDPDFCLPMDSEDKSSIVRSSSNQLNFSFRYDLKKPYQRAVALEVLRRVAQRPELQLVKAVLNDVNVQLECWAPKRSAEDNLLIQQIDESISLVDSYWDKYDVHEKNIIRDDQLANLLNDINVLDSNPIINVLRIMKVCDVDNLGLIERSDLLQFFEQAKIDVRERTMSTSLIVEAGRKTEYTPKINLEAGANIFEIQLAVDLECGNVVRVANASDVKKIMAVSKTTNDWRAALELNLMNILLHFDEGRVLMKDIRREIPDPTESLPIIMQCMSNTQHCRWLAAVELKTTCLRSSRSFETHEQVARGYQNLERELTTAFKPLMGQFNGHYRLGLSNRNDRLCMRLLIAQNKRESLQNRSMHTHIDTSQRGNWSCFRNEKLNGNSHNFSGDFLKRLPSSDHVEFDFVSTLRPKTLSFMSVEQFSSLLQKFEWAKKSNFTKPNFECMLQDYLENSYFRMGNEEIDTFDLEIGILCGDETCTPNTPDCREIYKVRQVAHQPTLMDAEGTLQQMRNEMNFRWLSCKQLRWILANFPVEIYNFIPKDWKVDLVVNLHSRIVDLIYFDFILEELAPQEKARIIHRLGWLNCFSPCRPYHDIVLDLKERQDRIICKIYINLNAIEKGAQTWKYREARNKEDILDWRFTTALHKEEGLPKTGIVRIHYEYADDNSEKKCTLCASLKMLLQYLVLAEAPLDDRDMIFQLTDGGTKSQLEVIVDTLRTQINPPITWKYDTKTEKKS